MFKLINARNSLAMIVAVGLVACGNSVPGDLIGTNVPLVSQSATGGTEMVQQLIISKVEEVIPGKLDYTLDAIVCNRGVARATQELKLASSDSTTEVLEGITQLRASNYGQCKLAQNGAWVVRSDKTKALDFTKLSITDTSQTQSGDALVRFIKVDLFAIGGRAGHEALLANNTQHITAGKTALLRAAVAGEISSISYQIKDIEGNVLSQALMNQRLEGNSEPYEAELITPNLPFKIIVEAKAKSGAVYIWSTDAYIPTESVLSVQMKNAVATDSSSVLSGAVAGRATDAGPLTVTLYPPAGFISSWTTKTLDASVAQQIALDFTLTPVGTKVATKGQLFVVYRSAFGKALLIKAPVLDLRN